MKREVILNNAISGIKFEINTADMVAIANMRDTLKAAMAEYRAVEEYNKLPYDKRKDVERPTEELYKALPDHIDKVIVLLSKLSIELPKSDIFDEEPYPCGPCED